MERRNPYLILGIPFGADRDTANKAFARRSKEARRAGGTLQTDLTWALQKVDEGPANPHAELEPYRVPADPAWSEAPGTGVFSPAPETLSFDDAAVAAALRALQSRAAQEYLRHLLALRSRHVQPPTT
jgi:hypothetical protein